MNQLYVYHTDDIERGGWDRCHLTNTDELYNEDTSALVIQAEVLN